MKSFIDGPKLRAFRLRRGVSASAVARELGRSTQRISQMEQRTVTAEAAERYLNAVAKLSGGRARYRVRIVVTTDHPRVSYEEVEEIRGLTS